MAAEIGEESLGACGARFRRWLGMCGRCCRSMIGSPVRVRALANGQILLSTHGSLDG